MIRHLSPAGLGRWSARRPWLAVGLWLAFVVAAVFALSVTGTRQHQDGAVGESARGNAAMNPHLVGFAPEAYGYLHSPSLRVDAPAFRSAIRDVAARAGSAESRLWVAVTERVLRRPLLAAVLATAPRVALAVPTLGLHVAKPSSGALATGGDSTLGRELTAAFPATSSPAVVVATFARDRRAAARRELRRFEQLAAARGIAHPPFQNAAGEDGQALDATLIRGVLLPAAMKLLGERNWYLPHWLERLPRLEEKRLPALPAPATD
jgi:uncharacterized membrane protein YdfJ with MMPL/SSD domain